MTRCPHNIPHNSLESAPRTTERPAQAIELAQCERGDLNPTAGREIPAFSRIATVKDRHRPPRIVPDRHNLDGADEVSRVPRPGSRHPGGIVSVARAAGYVSTIRYARIASGTRLRSQGRRTAASVPSGAVVRVTVKP
jgi:hypothetical protein